MSTVFLFVLNFVVGCYVGGMTIFLARKYRPVEVPHYKKFIDACKKGTLVSGNDRIVYIGFFEKINYGSLVAITERGDYRTFRENGMFSTTKSNQDLRILSEQMLSFDRRSL